MNVKQEDNSEYLKCNNCGNINLSEHKFLYSKICLHRICDQCYNKVFSLENPVFACKLCLKPHEVKHYNIKSREELYYETDLRNRNKLLGS